MRATRAAARVTPAVLAVLAVLAAVGLVGVVTSGVAEAGPTDRPPVSAVVATPAERHAPVPSDGRPARARLSIPAIGLRGLLVVPYVGRTDDAPGTRIQDRGVAAAPHGPSGGVGPGGVGSYQVTAHRSVHGAPFAHTPRLHPGDRVLVTAGGTTYVYEIRRRLWTSFRSAGSLRAQRSPVPGHPHHTATQARMLVSTCATPEDHAAGNYWSDALGNPEHRIDQVGVLVATRPAG